MPDIFLYSGEPNPNDVRLSDPTVQRGGSTVSASQSDTLALTDTLDATALAVASTSDTLALTDTVSATALAVASTSDTLTLTDTLNATALAVADLADTLALTDTLSATAVATADQADTLVITDTLDAVIVPGAEEQSYVTGRMYAWETQRRLFQEEEAQRLALEADDEEVLLLVATAFTQLNACRN